MGTKNNPGQFDCYTKADPDEPMFVLLARDPLAPHLINIWADLRQGATAAAFARFQMMLTEIGNRYSAKRDISKAGEAYYCAEQMTEWAEARQSNKPDAA